MNKFFCFVILFLSASVCFAQSTDEYVPCSEMPNLMQNFNADYNALQRFYTPADNNSPFGFNTSGDNGAASLEKRELMTR